MTELFCPNCGERISPNARFCRYCGVEIIYKIVPKKKNRNRYDESVKDFFSSKTFRFILFVGLSLGCCYVAISFSILGTALNFINDLLPSSDIQLQAQLATQQAIHDQTMTHPDVSQTNSYPYIVRAIDERWTLDKKTEDLINAWIIQFSPPDARYWFVTYKQVEDDGRILVSLAGMNLSSPDEKWTLVDDVNPDNNNKVIWIGTVVVDGNYVEEYRP